MRKLATLLARMRRGIVAALFAATPIGSQAAEQTVFYHLDALGSPVVATDEGGNVLWREEYRPYGDKIQNDPASAINSRAFTGHPHDITTGLTYAGARHYDPIVGRFMGVDPAAFDENDPTTFNGYSYVGNNPYKYVDPDGRARLPHNTEAGAGGARGRGTTPGGVGSGAGNGQPSPVSAATGRPNSPVANTGGRSGALNSAKRDLGIPRAQHPDEVNRVPMTDRNGTVALGADGKPIMTREYTYTRPDGSKVVVQDHSAGHRFGSGGVGDQGPHLNVRPPENTRTGSVPGTRDHYSW